MPSDRVQRVEVEAACLTDVGRIRTNNEDAYLMAPERDLYIVADGIGGHQAGELAAQAVVTVLPQLIERRLAGLVSPRSQTIEESLRGAITDLSQRLRAETIDRIDLQGMGTTVALALLRNGKAHIAHMGDSRIYLQRGDELTQLTADHSVVALLVKSAEITAAEARVHPVRSQLTRYVGMEGEPKPEAQTICLEPGDRLLICSDGLTSMIGDDAIADILCVNAAPVNACRVLVDAANAAGGQDNVTVLVVDCGR